jgi:outer membrane protein OmpA-like peptidoglycan-associated protein
MTTPSPATGKPADIAALLAPEGLLGTSDLLSTASVDAPAQQAVPVTALAAGTDRRSTDQQIEAGWSQANPAGKVISADSGNSITLWNFDVGSAELKPEHISALTEFISIVRLFPPGVVEKVAMGFASTTGGRQANLRLAGKRAQAVADWCGQQGITDVAAEAMDTLPGVDGEDFARARCVVVTKQPQPTAAGPAPTPRSMLLPGTSTAPPVPVSCGVTNTIDLNTGALVFYTLPTNGYLEGSFAFIGSIRLNFEDRDACVRVQESLPNLTSAGAAKITAAISKSLATRISFNRGWDGQATAAMSLLVGTNPWQWETGFQLAENWIVLKSPVFQFTDMLGLGDNVAEADLGGGDKVTLQVSGQLQFTGRPGSEITGPAMEWVEALSLGVAEAAVAVAIIAACGSVFYLLVDAMVAADSEGPRRAGVMARRFGFAAQLAVSVVDGASDEDADKFVSSYDEPRLRDMRTVVEQARKDATDAVAALADQKDARITALRAHYGTGQNGQALSYNSTAVALITGLGGYSTSDDSPPSLDQL